jgi:oligopeptide/dipeptide ABC transporter ATP-binding protein
MYLGRIVEVASKEAFFGRAAHPYSVGLIAASEIEAEGPASDRPLVIGDAPSATDPPPGCHFHPRCWLYGELDRPDGCRDSEPRLEQIETGHSSACFYRDQALARELGDRPLGATVTASRLGGRAAPHDREGLP